MNNNVMYLMPLIIITVFAFISIVVSFAAKTAKSRRTISSDGHVVPESEDLTCETTQGHRHENNSEFGNRYIVHNEPADGYVVLNGVMRKIEDCKDL